MADLSLPELIRKKRDGLSLTEKEMHFFVQSAYNGDADLSQIGAMLMAMYKSDLSGNETSALTSCMVNSGITLTWPGIVVDKHSTGGVGDKVSIPLVPALAALGLSIPMISGRGLGWTGGTLDKLESIPGYKTELSRASMERCLQQCSCFIAATTKDICPADKVLYKIRDITSTVDNVSLITGSILSKKIAAGVRNLVLDIKVGKGAFMKSVEDAEKLANSMISVSKSFDMKTRCVLTKMDNPIGLTIGNSLEIEESIDCLLMKGPDDLLELVAHLGGVLLEMCGKTETSIEGKEKIKQAISNGTALTCFQNMLLAQGVPSVVVSRLVKGDYSDLPKSKHQTVIKSKSKGYISSIDCMNLATVSWKLGAGRTKPEDKIDHNVGIRLHKGVADLVEVNQQLLTVYHNTPLMSNQTEELLSAFTISNEPIARSNLVIKSIM